MAMKFKCPACGQRDSVPDEMAGEKVKCRQCGAKIRLPSKRPTDVTATNAPAED